MMKADNGQQHNNHPMMGAAKDRLRAAVNDWWQKLLVMRALTVTQWCAMTKASCRGGYQHMQVVAGVETT
jgi:hypothetical protein